jgi:hypothetical protein
MERIRSPSVARERQEVRVVGDEVICSCCQSRLKNGTVVGITRHLVTGGARGLYENRAALDTLRVRRAKRRE